MDASLHPEVLHRWLTAIREKVVLGLGIRCPHCGSLHTRELSRFGSTSCKALWECLRCHEPFDRFKEQHAVATRMQLDSAKSQLSIAQQEAEAQRQARTAADEKTQQMLSQIQGLQSQKTDRGLVLTISGSVFFATGKAQLLEPAKKRLTDRALKAHLIEA